MGEKRLTSFFEQYLNKEPLFVNKNILQERYTPNNIPHREQMIEKIASILAPILRIEKPSNIFLYGRTGTGKTVSMKYIMQDLQTIAEKNDLSVKILYINCKMKRVADTEYRLIAKLVDELGSSVPATGLPTDEVYKEFLSILDKDKVLLVLVLDEVDELVNKTGEQILYTLTRLNSELKQSELSIVGIANNMNFLNHLDPRVKSSLSQEEILFPPYDAVQLLSILKERANIAFRKGAIAEGVLEKCAAYAAKEHGDARRALDLLRIAGELAERKNDTVITFNHIDDAEEKIERDRDVEFVKTLPKHSQIVLLSIFHCSANNTRPIFTGEIYDIYKDFCSKIKHKPLTQRRISDIIAEFDMQGVINTTVISKGRYGRTRKIKLAISVSSLPKLQKILVDSLGL